VADRRPLVENLGCSRGTPLGIIDRRFPRQEGRPGGGRSPHRPVGLPRRTLEGLGSRPGRRPVPKLLSRVHSRLPELPEIQGIHEYRSRIVTLLAEHHHELRVGGLGLTTMRQESAGSCLSARPALTSMLSRMDIFSP
jgi:hypothetical protein